MKNILTKTIVTSSLLKVQSAFATVPLLKGFKSPNTCQEAVKLVSITAGNNCASVGAYFKMLRAIVAGHIHNG